jgi:hypothetical protein
MAGINIKRFTASGTTPSRQKPISQIARLFADGPLGFEPTAQAGWINPFRGREAQAKENTSSSKLAWPKL